MEISERRGGVIFKGFPRVYIPSWVISYFVSSSVTCPTSASKKSQSRCEDVTVSLLNIQNKSTHFY